MCTVSTQPHSSLCPTQRRPTCMQPRTCSELLAPLLPTRPIRFVTFDFVFRSRVCRHPPVPFSFFSVPLFSLCQLTRGSITRDFITPTLHRSLQTAAVLIDRHRGIGLSRVCVNAALHVVHLLESRLGDCKKGKHMKPVHSNQPWYGASKTIRKRSQLTKKRCKLRGPHAVVAQTERRLRRIQDLSLQNLL